MHKTINFENLKGIILKSVITWSEMAQQKTQLKKDYWASNCCESVLRKYGSTSNQGFSQQTSSVLAYENIVLTT